MHADSCNNSHPSPKDFIVLKKVQRSDIIYLSVMEALFIKEENPLKYVLEEFKEPKAPVKELPRIKASSFKKLLNSEFFRFHKKV